MNMSCLLRKSIPIRGFIYSRRLLRTSACLSAGHSKWQNIKSVKDANDQRKSIVNNTVVSRIKAIAEAGKSMEYENNSSLKAVMEYCRKNDVPMEVFHRTIKKIKTQGERRKPMNFVYKGRDDSIIAFEVYSHNESNTRNGINKLFLKQCKEFSFKNSRLFPENIYEEHGRMIVVPKAENSFQILFEECFELELDDMNEEDGKIYIECPPKDLEKVRKFIEDKDYEIEYCEVEKDAIFFNKLSDEARNRLKTVTDDYLGQNSEINDIFINSEYK